MTSQWIRFAIEELLGPNVYIAPTYGNTLMGLAAAEMPTAQQNYKIAYYAPQPRAVAQVVEFNDYDKVVEYGKTGRVMLTTLTKEFFVPALHGARRGRARAAEREVSVGRRQRRAAVPRIRGDHDGRGVLEAWVSVTVRDMLRKLRDDGWVVVRQHGSHRQLHHVTKPGTVTVPGKPSDTLNPKTERSILRQAQLE